MKKSITPILAFILLLSIKIGAQEIARFAIPEGIENIIAYKISDDFKSFALFFTKEGKDYLLVNNKTYGPYENLIAYSGKFIDNNNFSFVYEKDKKYCLQINDSLVDTFDKVPGLLVSENGSTTIIDYTKDGGRFLNVNKKILGPFQTLENVFLSPNGKQYGFHYSNSNNEHFVQKNDKTYGPYNDLGWIHYSKDCSSIGFDYAKGQSAFTKINEKDFGPYTYNSSPVFSSDGKIFAFAFSKDDERFIQMNESVIGPISKSSVGWKISDDGKKYCCVIDKEGKEYIQYGKDVIGPFDGLRDLRISPDGSIWGIRYDIGDSIFIQIGKEIKLGPYSDVRYPVFAPKGSSFSFQFYKDGKWYVQINKQSFGPYDDATEVLFTPDGKNFSFVNYQTSYGQQFSSVITGTHFYSPYEIASTEITKKGMIYKITKSRNDNSFVVTEIK